MISEANDIDPSINNKSRERAKLQVNKITKQKSGIGLKGHESRAFLTSALAERFENFAHRGNNFLDRFKM